MKSALKLLVAMAGMAGLFAVFGGQQQPSCQPEDYCDTPKDCEGLVHPMCAGNWECVDHKCTYKCEITPLGCESDSDCEEGQKCVDGECKDLPKCKVTGCSGQVCADRDVITTCEYAFWYSCLKYTECGNYGPDGSCAWKPTKAYAECLASYGRSIACTTDEECPEDWTCEDGKCVEQTSDCIVTGCNSTICSDHEEVSTCEYRPWYKCYKFNKCGHFGSNGECAWLNPPQFEQCVQENQSDFNP